MPDDNETHKCDCSWGAKDVGYILTLLASLFVGVWNGQKVSNVEGKADSVIATQTEHIKTAQSNAGKLDKIEATTEKTERVAEKTEKAAVTAASLAQDTVGPQLMSSWLYLKSLSDEDPTAENLKRTAEAKAALDRHRALKP